MTRRSLLRSIGIVFPVLIFVGLVAIGVGTRLCGNVEHGKDVRVALERGDTVPANDLPVLPDGSPAYSYECVSERQPSRYAWPYVLLGIGLVGGILYLLAKDWRTRAAATRDEWMCPNCSTRNSGTALRCADCRAERPQ